MDTPITKKPRMNNLLYYIALGVDPATAVNKGGQELILADIMACLEGCSSIYIPYNCPALEEACLKRGIRLCNGDEYWETIYWGTPTIVNDKVLFPECLLDPQGNWSKRTEREASQRLTKLAEFNRECKRIITGLGSGDISLDERTEDMGGGHVVSFKDFGEFQDWIIVRNL